MSSIPSPAAPSPDLRAHDVKAHNVQDDCWIVVHGHVYDISDYIDRHPGGISSTSRVLQSPFLPPGENSSLRQKFSVEHSLPVPQSFSTMRAEMPPRRTTKSMPRTSSERHCRQRNKKDASIPPSSTNSCPGGTMARVRMTRPQRILPRKSHRHEYHRHPTPNRTCIN